MNWENLDDHTEGTFDKNAPFNQPDSNQENKSESISDALGCDDFETVSELISELRINVQILRDKAKLDDNIWLLRRLNTIYNLL